MRTLGLFTLRADDVGAYLWERATRAARADACVTVGIPNTASQLEWYEIDDADRIRLITQLKEHIVDVASRQRQASARHG